jgi:phage repressor protein C with HTH and peptisase S24 domain
MSTLKERLTLAMAKAKEQDSTKSQAGMARYCKVSKAAVTGWFSGGDIQSTNASLAAEYLGVSTDWLTRGKGPMERVRLSNMALSESSPPRYELSGVDPWDDDTPLEDDEVEVPFFKEVEFAAGAGMAHQVELNHRKLRYSRATLRNAGVEPANAACATNSGRSMEPLIQDGATIGIDRGRKQVVDGEIYAIDHDGMLRVKYLYRLPGGGLRLRSENDAEFPDENYDAEQAQRIKVLGWVWTWSTMRKWRGK